MQEFFALASFVCPGLLSPSLSVFNRVYGAPITAARDRDATPEQRRIGDDRQRELKRLKDAFVLRRTAEVNAKFLPPASTYIVFCRPSPLQACSLLASPRSMP
jgi:DNA repair and recombination protein RAD54B